MFLSAVFFGGGLLRKNTKRSVFCVPCLLLCLLLVCLCYMLVCSLCVCYVCAFVFVSVSRDVLVSVCVFGNCLFGGVCFVRCCCCVELCVCVAVCLFVCL